MIIRIAICVLSAVVISACEDDDPKINPAYVYFKVEEPDEANGDSYILALTDPDDIAQAREMITDITKRKIVLASITRNPNSNFYHNRDLNNDKTWSWHINEFLGFYDTTIEIYDGWPQYVEDNYDEWVANTKGSGSLGIIGFWGYTVTAEVDVSELE